MVRAMLYITVRSGCEEAFEQAWRLVAARVRSEPGNVRQALLRDPADSCSFVIASDWTSRDAFTQFERSDEQDELTAPLRELRESSRMAVYDVVADIEHG